ncbi:MAG: helix-turn-helix transcriptional regulator [Oscillospiraceae bacterium]|nr:helix-turn-helix transcriptional regulator [Oscillospiraceae bacterium]
MKIKTIDLEKQLSEADEFDEELIKQNPAPDFYLLIDELLKERNMKRSDLILHLNFERTYGYQILNGTRIPTKKQIILIGLYLGITVEQMQQLLKICGRECLYVRNVEDAKVVFALEHHYTYEQAMNFIYFPVEV